MVMSRRVFVDSDTGQEIIYFIRRGKPYLFLRDIVTKRFIKKLNYINIRVIQCIEYGKDKARKGNPVYVDNVTTTSLEAKHIHLLDKIKEWLEDRGYKVIASLFNRGVANQYELIGIEYGSEIKEFMGVKDVYPKYYYYHIVWKHHLEDKPKDKRGVETW
jgi:hypothetical protein